MDVYSAALALALAATGLAAVAAVTAAIAARRGRVDRSTALASLAARAAIAGAVVGGFSLSFHLLTGHRPGTDAAMSATRFVGEHPAPVVAVATSLLLVLLRRSS